MFLTFYKSNNVEIILFSLLEINAHNASVWIYFYLILEPEITWSGYSLE